MKTAGVNGVDLHVAIFGGGDQARANGGHPMLNLIEWGRRRATLTATLTGPDGVPVYPFEIRLQGEEETVFFDV